ncbi:MAG: SMI1/KNR4 family protein [bacterium]|nr:SMI1/KNR4 family protein [bacterium]
MNEPRTIIESTLTRLKEHGLFDQSATEFKTEDIRSWEEQFSLRFPKSFARVLTAGCYDIANFYFIEPVIIELESQEFLAFARWNDDRFAFAREDLSLEGPDHPVVYVLLGDEPPLERYADFATWFQEVAALADRPVNPE